MPKTVFAPGAVVPSDFLNALNNPTFVETPDADGEISLITNDDLSNAADQILPQWEAFRDGLAVSDGGGAIAAYQGGSVTLPNGTIQSIGAGTIALPSDAVSTIYVGATGVVASAINPPVLRTPLAIVTTVAGDISGAIVDLRPRFVVNPRAEAVKIFGGTGAQGDKTATNAETFDQGLYYYNNFTVPAGVTITVSKFARFFCAGAVVINGTINVTQATLGGGTLPVSAGGGAPGNGLGGGATSLVQGGGTYNYSLQSSGSGGSTGFLSGATAGDNGLLSSGGGGGGGLLIEAAGIITVGGTINAPGGNAAVGVLSAGSPNISGGGGGSGGLILLSSLVSVTCTGTSVINVQGGNGANAVAGNASGGAMGGGGQVVLISPVNNTTGATINLAIGTRGTAIGTPAIGGGFGGGFGGLGGGGGTGGLNATVGVLISRTFQGVG